MLHYVTLSFTYSADEKNSLKNTVPASCYQSGLDRLISQLETPAMQPTQFMDAVQAVLAQDTHYDIGAYYFLKDALDFTVKRVVDSHDGEHRHVSAQELTVGFRDLALQEFGPMASTLMTEWGIKSGKDVGTMVFQLIKEGAFGKQDSDTLDDFSNGFDLLETLKFPFLPQRSRAMS